MSGHPSFKSVKHEGTRLSGGFTDRVHAVLQIGDLQAPVTVSGAASVVDVSSTAATTLLTRETLHLIPTTRSGYNAMLAQAPGVRQNVFAQAPNNRRASRGSLRGRMSKCDEIRF